MECKLNWNRMRDRHDCKTELARSTSLIWNHKYDFRSKLHDISPIITLLHSILKLQFLSAKTDTGLKSVQILHYHSFFLSLSQTRDRMKTPFPFSLTSSKLTISFILLTTSSYSNAVRKRIHPFLAKRGILHPMASLSSVFLQFDRLYVKKAMTSDWLFWF